MATKIILKYVAPKAFNDGLARANDLGRSLISARGIERFLDAGCGNGELTMTFAELARPREVHGIDFVDEYSESAEKRGIICRREDLNDRWSFEDNYFDLILSSQSIEHLHNTRRFVEECYRCLKPGGEIIILTENLASWVNIGALVLGWQPFSMTNVNGWSLGNPLIWHMDEPKDSTLCDRWHDTGLSGAVGHARVLAYKGFRDILAKVGFCKVDILTRGYLPLWGKVSDLLCSIDKRHGHFLIATGFKEPGPPRPHL